MSDFFAKLKLKLEGKTIKAIEPGGVSESICTFVLEGGHRFRLCATDLGFWIEDTVAEGGLYDDLTALLRDYYNHAYHRGDVEDPSVSVFGGVLTVTAKDGTSFRGQIANFNEADRAVVNHQDGSKIISASAPLGDAWTTFLCHSQYPDICPPELSRR